MYRSFSKAIGEPWQIELQVCTIQSKTTGLPESVFGIFPFLLPTGNVLPKLDCTVPDIATACIFVSGSFILTISWLICWKYMGCRMTSASMTVSTLEG